MKVRVASAGTGKTTRLVVGYLERIGSGTPLRRIAGVTFTGTAAAELRQRVGRAVRTLLDEGTYLDGLYRLEPEARPAFEEALLELDGATLSTIHGFMRVALRLVAPTMGLDPDFRNLGEWEAGAMFEEEVRSLLYLAADPGHGLHGASQALGEQAGAWLLLLFRQRSLAERFGSDGHPRNRALLQLFEAAYKRFELRLGARLLPPSEVERRALLLVATAPALERLAQRFRVVLVDEFQDVNPLQGRFFERLEQGGLEVEVVGDPKQSIYGFRHADVEVFRRALRRGEVLEPLSATRRHGRILTRFLNHMTRTLAEADLGFGPAEAPEVQSAGPQAETGGRVEVHWVTGDAPIAELRGREAEVLAERLSLLRQQGRAWSDMAVLARSNSALQQVEEGLRRAGLPYVLLQGRGYYERLEIRDLYHALRVGVEPAGLSLGAWLRSPFAQLPLDELDAVLRADEALQALRLRQPRLAERLELLHDAVRGTPLAALKFLIREPFIGGRRYVDYLDARARENVDALLFTVAQQPPGNLELLLERLELLSRQADAGDVPQSGDGVQLLTVHRAKGLEWPVVAVFDCGRGDYHPAQPLYIEPTEGTVFCRDTDGFEDVREIVRRRAEAESYRLLYVAASRSRDVLILTGSAANGYSSAPSRGWVAALETMGVGPSGRPLDRPEFLLRTYPFDPATAPPPPEKGPEEAGPEPAPWIDQSFPRFSHPPVQSPSRLKGEAEHEPLPFSDPDEGERLPGWAATVGTLVHYAISQDWSAGNPRHLENLRAQEVMFPYSPEEQNDLLAEVKLLLGNYEGLLGGALPGLDRRGEDHPELPMALPAGPTVWQGVIDRLYCAGGRWYLDDYKTDQTVVPERYHFQLAVYLEAVRRVRGVTPEVRLVFLRSREVLPIDHELLEAAFAAEALPPSALEG